jgi:hypothetical protein
MTGVSYRAGCWNTASPITSKLPDTESQATRLDPITNARTPYMASAKNMTPAYITATYRALREIDDSASIVSEATITRMSDATTIAGRIEGFSRTNARLPESTTCMTSSISPGTSVTPSRNVQRTASLPAMYSIRRIGFDR